MDALFILGNLGQSRQVGVALHIIFVAMAFPASAGDIQRVDRRAGVGDQLGIVNAVAVDAGGHAAVALPQELPVLAGVVQPQLIGLNAGVVAVHVSGIGMAAPAEFRNLFAGGFAAESLGCTHGHFRIHAGGIAPVAGGAGQSPFGVDVGGKRG